MSSIILFYASVFRSVVDSTKTIRHLERLVWVYVISSALYGPPTTPRLSPFSCILVALGNCLLHSKFLFSVRAESFAVVRRCSFGLQTWVDAPASTFYHAPGSTGGLDMRFLEQRSACVHIDHSHASSTAEVKQSEWQAVHVYNMNNHEIWQAGLNLSKSIAGNEM